MSKANPKSISPRLRRAPAKDTPTPLHDRAEELMELAVDAAQSRHLPEFLERFAQRAARMLDAQWCGVMVFRGRETDLYQAAPGQIQLEPTQHTALIRYGREAHTAIEVHSPIEQFAVFRGY